MSVPKGSKTTNYIHLTKVYETTKKWPAQLDSPKCMEELLYLWDYYLKIKTSEKLTYSEIYYYCRLTGCTLSSFEIKMIMQIDSEYWRGINNEQYRYSNSPT